MLYEIYDTGSEELFEANDWQQAISHGKSILHSWWADQLSIGDKASASIREIDEDGDITGVRVIVIVL